MGILNRRDTSKQPTTKIVADKKVVAKTTIIDKKPVDNKKFPLLTLFPGGAKKKDDVQIDPERVEALKKWRDEELKDYKVSIIDSSTAKNPSIQKIAKTIIDCDGFLMKSAIKLGVTYNRLNKIIKTAPKLRDIIQDSTEAFLDLAENKLKDAVLAGNMTAIVFTLKNKGANRGWRDEDGVKSISDDKPVAFSYNLRLPPGCKLVTDEGVEVYRPENKVEEVKKVENG